MTLIKHEILKIEHLIFNYDLKLSEQIRSFGNEYICNVQTIVFITQFQN